MDYLQAEFLKEDLISDLGLNSGAGKGIMKSGANLVSELLNFKDLLEVNDEAKYEEFLSNGFKEIIQKYGKDSGFLVTYDKKGMFGKAKKGNLFTITGVTTSKLGVPMLVLTGFSPNISGKKLNLNLKDIEVNRASKGSTGYTSTNYQKLVKLLDEPVKYINGKEEVDATIQDVNQEHVVLISTDNRRAELSHENYYTSSSDGVLKIVNASIIFQIKDLVFNKGEEKKFTVNKSLFNITDQDLNPDSPFTSKSDELAKKNRNYFSTQKNKLIILTPMSNSSIEDYKANKDNSILKANVSSQKETSFIVRVTNVDSSFIYYTALGGSNKDKDKKNPVGKLSNYQVITYLSNYEDQYFTDFVKKLGVETESNNFPVLFYKEEEKKSVASKMNNDYLNPGASSGGSDKSLSEIEKNVETFMSNLKDKDLKSRVNDFYISGLQNTNVKFKIIVADKEPYSGILFSLNSFDSNTGKAKLIGEGENPKEVLVDFNRLISATTVRGKNTMILKFTEKDENEGEADNQGGDNSSSDNNNTSQPKEPSQVPPTGSTPKKESTIIDEELLISFFE
jgi:hypothetical protein